MSGLKVAHIREQGIDLIIAPLDHNFGYISEREQTETIAEIQVRANRAGLRGTVVPVWDNGGRMAFRAPPNWHPFFRSLSLQAVWANVNRELH